MTGRCAHERCARAHRSVRGTRHRVGEGNLRVATEPPSSEFINFLSKINREVRDHLDVHVVLDNLSTHETPASHKWLLRHRRFHFHFTPTYLSGEVWRALFDIPPTFGLRLMTVHERVPSGQRLTAT